MEKAKEFGKGILFGFGLFILYNLICPEIYQMIFHNFLTNDNYWVRNFINLGMYVFTFLVLLLIVHKDIFKQFKEFKKEPKKFLNKGFTYWAYGIMVMLISNLIISSLVKNIAVNEQVTRELLKSYPIFSVPTIIFFGPFLEELVFRYGFRKSFHKELPYALFSAFVFGLLHVLTAIDTFTIQNILAHASEFLFIIPYGSLGFFFAKAYYETDNIFTSAIPHMLHNTFSVVLIFLMNFFM